MENKYQTQDAPVNFWSIFQIGFEKASNKILVAVRNPAINASVQLVQQNSLYVSVYFFNSAFSSSLSFCDNFSST